MNQSKKYRLYTFVANHYLSPLQCGLQTAHVVAELGAKVLEDLDDNKPLDDAKAFREWAELDKTIIICGAGNHQGVVDCYAELKRTGIDTGLVAGAIFREDEQSMNGMATACGVIVPQKYWDAKFKAGDPVSEGPENYLNHWIYTDENGYEQKYSIGSPEDLFIDCIKRYRLA